MERWSPWLAPIVLMLAVAACSQAPAPKAESPAAATDRMLKLNMPRSPQQPAVYRYAGESYQDPDIFLGRVWADSNRELSGVVPSAMPVGGGVRMALPTFEAMPIKRDGRWADTNFYVELYARILDDEKVEAVRRARLFQSIVVDYTDVPAQGHGNGDFTLWKEGPGWWIRHRDGDAFLITQSAPGLASWLRGLRVAAILSRDGRGESPR